MQGSRQGTRPDVPGQRHRVRVRFALDPDDWHGQAIEWLWAEVLGASSGQTLLQLENSPFYARGISYLDVIEAAEAPDGSLRFTRVVDRFGHSTFRILLPPEADDVAGPSAALEGLGCSFELGIIATSLGEQVLFSIDVPEPGQVAAVLDLLEDGERAGRWVFEEGHHAGNS